MTEFSIVLPIYNTPAEYFRACVASIQAQHCTDYEVLLIDDGSTNGVGTLCDELAAQDSRFRVFHQANGGVSAARNTGLRTACGQWLICLDPDDWWEPDLLESAHTRLTQHPVDLLIFSYCTETDGHRTDFSMGLPEPFQIGGEKLLHNLQLGLLDEPHRTVKTYFGGPCFQFVRRELVTKYQIYFDPALRQSEDALWDMNLLEHAESAALLDHVFYHYRIYSTSSYHRYDPALPQLIEQIDQQFRAFGEEHQKGADYWAAYRFWLIKKYIQLLKMYFFHPASLKTDRKTRQEWQQLFHTCPSLLAIRELSLSELYRARKIYTLFYLFLFRVPSYALTKRLFTVAHKNGKI